MSRLRPLAAFVLPAALAPALLGAATREVKTPIPAVAEVEVRNLAGRVALEASEGDDGELVAVIHAEGKTDAETRKLLAELDVAFESSGGRFTAHARYPVGVDRVAYPRGGEEGGFFSSMLANHSRTNVSYDGRRMTVVTSGGHAPRLWVEFRVRLPRGAAVRVRNEVGFVSGEVPGAAWVRTGDGNVRLERLGSGAEVRTGSGDVSLTNVPGDVRVSTGSGDVALERVAGGIDVSTGSGDVKVRDLTAAGPVFVHTASGDVTIELAKSQPLRLEATTSSGSLAADLPGLRTLHRTDRELGAEVGGGGPSFRISTASGDVRLSSR